MSLTTREVSSRLKAFAADPFYRQMTREKADEKLFTKELMKCFGIEAHQYNREQKITLLDGKTGYADAFIPQILLVEAKSAGKNLARAREQAEDYRWGIPVAQQPRYILLHDFQNFVLCDLEEDKELCCTLAELPDHAKAFSFLYQERSTVVVEENPINREAAYQISRLHAELLAAGYAGHDLELFLTRLLFCFFADDTLIFNEAGMVHRWLAASREDGDDLGSRISRLFETLNAPIPSRQKNLNEDLAQFGYVNGGLFAERIALPEFDGKLRHLLLACSAMDWSEISPAIFGSMFQGILEENDPNSSRKKSRSELGAHYTSEKNILKAINTLFMDELRSSLKSATSRAAQFALHEKIAALHFFDPACGCGNFLVIAYRELRRLEMDLIAKLYKTNLRDTLGAIATYQKVSINQFFGIEIEEHACEIAKTALYITDHQMNREAESRFGKARPTIPLHDIPHITCANALTTDWATVLPPQDCHYIIGNPPFVGKNKQTPAQKQEMEAIAGSLKNGGVLDYVAAWYLKAADYMAHNRQIAAALVSTNSITQGEQAAVLWQPLFARGIHIQFAHHTFKWQNEGKDVAAVHCVIIAFAYRQPEKPVIFHYADIAGEPKARAAQNINAYLLDSGNPAVERRGKPISGETEIRFGSMPNDGGYLLLSPEEKDALLAAEPLVKKYIRPFLGADEFLNGRERWCLWFSGCDLTELNDDLKKMPQVAQRIENVKTTRKESKRPATNELATVPHLFGFISQPESGNYLLIPSVSSENRQYIPIGFMDCNIIVSNLAFSLPNATLYHFGILSSAMHNAFMRTVAGRLESRYRYSAGIVYNNFPFPFAAQRQPENAAENQARSKIEAAAQTVLNVREQYRQAAREKGHAPPTLAQFYNGYTVHPYPELVKAHKKLNKAVDAAYGYTGADNDTERVAFLFDLYQARLAMEKAK
jgi:hypothetical protein